MKMISSERYLSICVIISPSKDAFGDQLIDSFRSQLLASDSEAVSGSSRRRNITHEGYLCCDANTLPSFR